VHVVGLHLRELLRHLVDLQYQRNEAALSRSRFRVRGDTLEIGPASEDHVVRVEFFGDEIERITELDPLTGELLAERKELNVYPATHFVTPADKMAVALGTIEAEMTSGSASSRPKAGCSRPPACASGRRSTSR
jgi:excinuclease ABC subunit B